MVRPERSSERHATLPGGMGTTSHEMSKRERAKRNRPEEFRYVVNIRHFQNGIGIVGLLGIVLIFVYLALDPGSPGAPSAVTSGLTTPLTAPSTSGNVPNSGVSSALPPIIAPSSAIIVIVIVIVERVTKFTNKHQQPSGVIWIEVHINLPSGNERI